MSQNKETDRRTFCIQACQAASCVALGLLAQACGGNSESAPSDVPQLSSVNGNVSAGTVVVQVAAGSPLAATGGAAIVLSSGGTFLVSRTGQDTFAAVTAMCTHEACTITGFDGSNYVCPCHGSRFTTGGRVVNGPATSPLRTFSTQFTNNVLTINL